MTRSSISTVTASNTGEKERKRERESSFGENKDSEFTRTVNESGAALVDRAIEESNAEDDVAQIAELFFARFDRRLAGAKTNVETKLILIFQKKCGNMF